MKKNNPFVVAGILVIAILSVTEQVLIYLQGTEEIKRGLVYIIAGLLVAVINKCFYDGIKDEFIEIAKQHPSREINVRQRTNLIFVCIQLVMISILAFSEILPNNPEEHSNPLLMIIFSLMFFIPAFILAMWRFEIALLPDKKSENTPGSMYDGKALRAAIDDKVVFETITKKLGDPDEKHYQVKLYKSGTIKTIPVKIKNSLPDLTQEFGELMTFISSVAIDIRMYSTYSNGVRSDGEGNDFDSWSDPNTSYDLMYLSEILHNLCMFYDDKPENIIFACDHHINTFERYLRKDSFGNENIKNNPADTFERHKYNVDLNKAIAIFKRIKAKCTEEI